MRDIVGRRQALEDGFEIVDVDAVADRYGMSRWTVIECRRVWKFTRRIDRKIYARREDIDSWATQRGMVAQSQWKAAPKAETVRLTVVDSLGKRTELATFAVDDACNAPSGMLHAFSSDTEDWFVIRHVRHASEHQNQYQDNDETTFAGLTVGSSSELPF